MKAIDGFSWRMQNVERVQQLIFLALVSVLTYALRALGVGIGKLLTFIFPVNMIGAIVLLPALAAWVIKPTPNGAGAR